MGRRIKSNFDRRFENRISITYSDKPMRVTDQYIQNERISQGFNRVLSGIIGREPTDGEIFGLENIEEKLRKMERL